MKELSVEEKAKRYDKAIETARKINSGEGVASPPDWTICEVIFPELKELEDERIRKNIINLVIKSAQNGGMALHKWESQQMLAWLEKQDEQKSIDNLTPQETMDIAVAKCFDKQKPDWTKKDEEYFNSIVQTLRHYVINGGSEAKKYTEEKINWLKSKCR